MKKALLILLLLPLFSFGQRIHINSTADTVCIDLPSVFFSSFDSGVSTSYYQWTINGLPVNGERADHFIYNTFANGDSVVCLLTDSTYTNVIARSNSIVVTVLGHPYAGNITGTDTFMCVGSSIILYDTTAGGVWSASSPAATVVSGVVTGEENAGSEEGYLGTPVNIYYTVSNACYSTVSLKAITVVPMPHAGGFYLGYPYNFQTALCVGETEPVNGGDGIEGQVYLTNDDVTYGGERMSGVHPGTDSVIIVVTNACGSDTSRSAVQVLKPSVPPAAIYAPFNKVCVRSSITLVDSTALQPAWACTSNASIIKGVLTGIHPGMDTVYFIASNQCGADTVSTIINVEGPAQVMGIDSFCVSNKARFTDSTIGGVWSVSNTSLATVDADGNLTALDSGILSVSYNLPSSGCTTSFKTKLLPEYLPSPITGESIFCLSGTTSLAEETTGGKWSSGDLAVATINISGEVYGAGRGATTISYSLKGCIQTKAIEVLPCSNEASIYPNPAHNQLTIYTFMNLYDTYTFTDIIGQRVLKGRLAGPFTTIDIDLLKAGLYNITISGPQNNYVTKFVKD